MDVTAPPAAGLRIISFDLVQTRLLMAMVSGFLGLIGAVLYSGGAVIAELANAGPSQSLQASQPERARAFAEWKDQRECPHCLSSISRKAKVCAHCARDVTSAPPRRGLKITQVVSASAAGYAGLAAEDVIIQIDGRDVEHPEALDEAIAQASGNYLIMSVVRRHAFLSFKLLVPATSGKVGINVEPFAFPA